MSNKMTFLTQYNVLSNRIKFNVRNSLFSNDRISITNRFIFVILSFIRYLFRLRVLFFSLTFFRHFFYFDSYTYTNSRKYKINKVKKKKKIVFLKTYNFGVYTLGLDDIIRSETADALGLSDKTGDTLG